jgi:septum formation protein
LNSRTLILASASPRRQRLLSEWGIPFKVLPPVGVDESRIEGEAVAVARTLAREKALWSRRQAIVRGGCAKTLWVLACDTVVAFGGDILGKPADPTDARQILRRLSGNSHEVISGVAVILPDGSLRSACEVSQVSFKDLSPPTIDRYVDSGDALGKAGAYGIQSGGRALVAGFTGCYYNIVGLPMRLTLRFLDLPPPDCDCATHPLQRGEPGCREDVGTRVR